GQGGVAGGRTEELLVAGVVVHETLQPRNHVLGDRGVRRGRGEVGSSREFQVSLLRRRRNAVVERNRVLVHRRDRVVLGADDERRHASVGPRLRGVPRRQRDRGLQY